MYGSRRMVAAVVTALLVGFSLLACSEDLVGPGPSLGVELHLTSVAGKTLPASFGLVQGGELVVRADVIRLYEDETWERDLSFILEQGGERTDRTLTESGSLTAVDEGWALDFECQDVLIRQCVPPDTLRMGADEARIDRSSIWFSLESLRYRVVE